MFKKFAAWIIRKAKSIDDKISNFFSDFKEKWSESKTDASKFVIRKVVNQVGKIVIPLVSAVLMFACVPPLAAAIATLPIYRIVDKLDLPPVLKIVIHMCVFYGMLQLMFIAPVVVYFLGIYAIMEDFKRVGYSFKNLKEEYKNEVEKIANEAATVAKDLAGSEIGSEAPVAVSK